MENRPKYIIPKDRSEALDLERTRLQKETGDEKEMNILALRLLKSRMARKRPKT